MKHGDIIKIAIDKGWIEGTFVQWEDADTILFEDRLGNALYTYYKNVIAINGLKV